MTFIIREFYQNDVQEVIAIERACFTSPWSDNVFHVLANFAGHIQIAEGVLIHARIGESEKTVAGYVIWKDNHAKQRGHLLNIAVAVSFRRKGLGTYLALHTLEAMRAAGMNSCILEVRESNIAAIELYESLGFQRTGRECEYYAGEDALVYEITF